MSEIPSMRQEQIMEWLRESRTLTIDALAGRLGVSIMTVHRDLDTLERAGLAEKVHGGVTLPKSRKPLFQSGQVCKSCQMTVPSRTLFVVQTDRGEQLRTCCPHCGLLLLRETQSVSALARDFLYGRMVNAWQAVYLLESDISLCCVPSVLAFASREDAIRFRRGFNGTIMIFQEAQDTLAGNHCKVCRSK